MNKALFSLDLRCLRKVIIIGSTLLSLIVIAVWLFVYFTNKDVSIDTFHVDYQYILVKVLSPIAVFISMYIGRYVYPQYHNFQINENLYTTNISKKMHFITHVSSASIAVISLVSISTLTIVTVSLLFNVFTLRLLVIQVCFLIGLLSASFIAQTLVILNKARSTTTWILAIPIISYIFSIISDTLKGLNTKTIIVLNNIFKYIDFLSFYSIDLEATNISNIAEIDFLHMTIIFIISTILLVSSFRKFRTKEMI